MFTIDRHANLRGHRHPLAEQLVLSVKTPVSQFTPFQHLLVGAVLEEFKRIKRQQS